MKLYNEIVDNLYLGNAACQKLSEKPEKAISCLTFGVKDTGAPRWAKNYQFFQLEDRATVDKEVFTQIMNQSYEFIKQSLIKGPLLVHCGLGVSRSGAAVIFFIMKEKNLSYVEAFKFVQSKRQCVLPNPGFQQILKSLQ